MFDMGAKVQKVQKLKGIKKAAGAAF